VLCFSSASLPFPSTVVPTPTMIDHRGVAAATARELDPDRKVFPIQVLSIHPTGPCWFALAIFTPYEAFGHGPYPRACTLLQGSSQSGYVKTVNCNWCECTYSDTLSGFFLGGKAGRLVVPVSVLSVSTRTLGPAHYCKGLVSQDT